MPILINNTNVRKQWVAFCGAFQTDIIYEPANEDSTVMQQIILDPVLLWFFL